MDGKDGHGLKRENIGPRVTINYCPLQPFFKKKTPQELI